MDQSAKLNILVTDDHTLFRKGTIMLLKSFDFVGEVDEAENGRDALDKLKSRHFDLILLDLEMPVLDGWETSKKVVNRFPELKIIMVSMHDSLPIISDLIEIGVHSYLLKNADPSEVKKAILSVINNDFYYNQLVSNALKRKPQAANEKKKKRPGDRISRGTKITEERLQGVNNYQGINIRYTDLHDKDGVACGTEVLVFYPIQYRKN